MWDRARRPADKLRRRLGSEAGTDAIFSPRPKGMCRRNYQRLRKQGSDAEMRATDAFIIQTRRLLARINSTERRRSW
jgi:hypothetical protein